jgi:hypothetical protein
VNARILNVKLIISALFAIGASAVAYAAGWGGLVRSNVPGVSSADGGTVFSNVTATSDYTAGWCDEWAYLGVTGGCSMSNSNPQTASANSGCYDVSVSSTITMTMSSISACTISYRADAYSQTEQRIDQVIKINQDVDWTVPASSVLGSADYNITAVAKSSDLVTATGMTVTLSSNTTGICTISGTLVHNVAEGTCEIQADVAGDGDRATATKTTSWPIASVPVLTLATTVVNDDGLSSVETDFTLQAAGPSTISGVEGDSAITSAVVTAGTYTLSQTAGPADYSASTWSCTAGSLSGSDLTLANGDIAVCTITNDDKALPLLTLAKTVINDGAGSAVDTDFTLQAAGPSTISGVEGDGAITSASLAVGTYSLTESGGPGTYTFLGWSCSAGSLVGADVTLARGDVATCTVTNDDGLLVVTKTQSVISDGFSASGKEKSMPGATLRYTLTLDNSTSAIDATDLDVLDDFDDSKVTYSVNSVVVNGESISDGGTGVGSGVSANVTVSDEGGSAKKDRVRVQGFTVPALGSWDITFEVTVD